MKKAQIAALLFAVLLLTGCRSIYESEYSYSEKFAGEIGDFTKGAIEIKNYANLQNTILALIENGEKSASLVFSRYVGSPADDLAKICYEIRAVNPLGNFALSDISYDTSRIVSYYTADVALEYKRTKAEITPLSKAISLAEAEKKLEEAISVGQDTILLRCSSIIPSEEYFKELAKSYYYCNLSECLFLPEIEMLCYPETGTDRIYELHLYYAITGAPELERMRNRLSSVLNEAILAVEEDAAADEGLNPEAQKYLDAARYICSLNSGETPGSFPDTAYGLFCEQYASSEGLALAYKLLCDSLELECIVAEGNDAELGSNDSVFWNIITIGDYSYHMLLDKKADVDHHNPNLKDSECFFLSDENLHSRISKDSDSYPPCIGPILLTNITEDAELIPDVPPGEEHSEERDSKNEGNSENNEENPTDSVISGEEENAPEDGSSDASPDSADPTPPVGENETGGSPLNSSENP